MNLTRVLRVVKKKLGLKTGKLELQASWFKKDKSSWLYNNFSAGLSHISVPPMAEKIEELAQRASELGNMPLWKGFEKLDNYPFPVKNATRNANQVRVDQRIGHLFYHLVREKQPEVILEIGTAFGVSGMYWLRGLEDNRKGKLITFEPNDLWAKVANSNLEAMGTRYTLCVTTFEEKHETYFRSSPPIDIAFIDAIHTSDAVNAQFDLILSYSKPGTLILFDDIEFSRDMYNCWRSIANSIKTKASFEVSGRVGIVEL